MAQIRGLSYPLKVTRGQLSLSEDSDVVAEHILSVLETRPYERIMRADYGLQDQIFDLMEPIAINAKISAAILEQVGEVENLSVTGNWTKGDSGIYNVRITYDLSGAPQPPVQLSLAI